jgi:3',5'-cyclic AMP phosphodiesterase CpdA
MTWILHLSDLHLGDVSPGQTLTDAKVIVSDQPDLETTQTVLKRALKRLEVYVGEHGAPDAVVISGDLTYQARESGFTAFRQLLDRYTYLWPDRSRVVVVPGNHDVVWTHAPGTEERYSGFIRATRPECTTPLLDGVDFHTGSGRPTPKTLKGKHLIEHADFLVIPINSSNFCGVFVDLVDRWTREKWEQALEPLGEDRDEALEELDYLRRHDMARVSGAQIEALGELLRKLKIPKANDGRTRIAVIHHQLLPVSTREERKAFESISNLGVVRQLLREYEIDVVLHGHKHEAALFWDFLRDQHDSLADPPRRVLVAASPGHFDVTDPVMRAFHFEGNARARNLQVVAFEGPVSSSGKPNIVEETVAPIWFTAMDAISAERRFLRGDSPETAYARLRAFFEAAENVEPIRNLVCQVDDPTGADHLPLDYPSLPENVNADAWFRDLVDWWQLDWPRLVHERVLLFNHGERIYSRFGNQIDRAARLLVERGDSSRAIVVLVHPSETGRYPKDSRDLHRGSFPAFALAEFALTERGGNPELDCFGYFRKQEFQYWWPVNLAELARLQAKVAEKMASQKPQLGRIVTFSGIAVWDTTLPGVAVPELDRLLDSPERMTAMAAAVVFPTAATDQARSDWNRVLVDLRGEQRHALPIPALGDRELRAEIRRLQRASGSNQGGAVLRRLRDLTQRYEAVNRSDPNSAAVALITDAVDQLSASVRRALR